MWPINPLNREWARDNQQNQNQYRTEKYVWYKIMIYGIWYILSNNKETPLILFRNWYHTYTPSPSSLLYLERVVNKPPGRWTCTQGLAHYINHPSPSLSTFSLLSSLPPTAPLNKPKKKRSQKIIKYPPPPFPRIQYIPNSLKKTNTNKYITNCHPVNPPHPHLPPSPLRAYDYGI